MNDHVIVRIELKSNTVVEATCVDFYQDQDAAQEARDKLEWYEDNDNVQFIVMVAPNGVSPN